MCLSIPAKVDKIEGEKALVSVGGTTYNASLQMLDDVDEGDYVLIHAGFVIQKISPEEAERTLKVFEEYEELNRQLDDDEKKTGKRIT